MNNYKQQVVDFFNRRTAYDDEGDSHPNEARRLLEYLPLTSGQSVLDIATGTGLVAIPAAKAILPHGNAIGVDISPVMLAQAREKIAIANIDNLELIEGDIERIDFSEEQFDRIFCCSALVYVSDIPAMLDKCYRWLKPEGCLAFTTSDCNSYLADLKVKVSRDLFDIELPHILRPLWTPEKCISLLQKSGFRNIEIERQPKRYRIVKNSDWTKITNELYPQGNPLQNLSKTQIEHFQTEFQKAIDDLIAEGGEWRERNNLYVRAWK